MTTLIHKMFVAHALLMCMWGTYSIRAFSSIVCPIAFLFSLISVYISLSLFLFLIISLVPSGPPQHVAVTALSSSSVRLSWGPPLPNAQNGLIEFYQVLYKACNFSLVTTLVVDTALTVDIDGLEAGTEYCFEVAAATSVGIGPLSTPSVRCQTPEGRESGLYLFRCHGPLYFFCLTSANLLCGKRAWPYSVQAVCKNCLLDKIFQGPVQISCH